MNIFFLDENPELAAQYLVDRHVVKMILESAQILSTAHRVCDGKQVTVSQNGRKIKRWILEDSVMESCLYKSTHVNHPSVLWARQNSANYEWLFSHLLANLDEYKFRYGKNHVVLAKMPLLANMPKRIKYSPHITPIMLAMPDEYKIHDCHVECYREYYRVGKAHLHSWKYRGKPEWI